MHIVFGHGNGFCKQVWEPVIQRLQNSAALRDTEFTAFDFSFHGDTKVDEAREDDAGNWPEWAPRDTENIVKSIKKQTDGKVIGIGHSMGGGAFLKAQANAGENPLFDELLLFEPIVLPALPTPSAAIFRNIGLQLAAKTANRVREWNSWSEVERYFNKPAFQSWDKDCLQSYKRGAIRNENGKYVLKCDPDSEVAIFNSIAFFSDNEIANLHDQNIHFFFGSMKHHGFGLNLFKPFLSKVKNVNVNGIVHEFPNHGHLMPIEDPNYMAKVIEQILLKGQLSNL